jgi:hypothetical protein
VLSDRFHRLPRGGFIAAVVATLVLLAGCGGDDKPPETEGKTVDEIFGLEGDAILERQKRAESLIAPCMQKQGFRYTPVDPVQQQAALTGTQKLTEEEFNEQFGYGITTLFEQRLRASTLGPNQAYYDSLTDSEKAAFDRALYGNDKTATFAVVLDTGEFDRLGGCLKEATDEVFGGAELIEDVTAKLDELDQRILADARMVEVVEKWSDCMSEAGYSFLDPEEVDAYLENQLETIVGPIETATAPAPGAQPEWDTAALRRLQQEEVEIVQKDIACEEEHITEVEDKVRPEYEREFLEENAALVDRVPQP